MINNRRTRQRGAWTALGLSVLLLQACSQNKAPPLPTSSARVFATDVTGAAKVCEVPKLSPTEGQTSDATMKVGNDGGWCGLTVVQRSGEPYDAGLLTARPAHGTVLIHKVGDSTRIDYTPQQGFAGTDTFTVKLLPGNPAIRVAVTVVPPQSAAPQTKS